MARLVTPGAGGSIAYRAPYAGMTIWTITELYLRLCMSRGSQPARGGLPALSRRAGGFAAAPSCGGVTMSSFSMAHTHGGAQIDAGGRMVAQASAIGARALAAPSALLDFFKRDLTASITAGAC